MLGRTAMNETIERVVIVGGGTAGWLAAARLASSPRAVAGRLSVTLIEAPDIPTIGVGGQRRSADEPHDERGSGEQPGLRDDGEADGDAQADQIEEARRSEEHTSELQSLMRISYAVFCLKKKK